MDFLFELTIPANTTEDAPTETDVNIGSGVVVKCEVGFPEGLGALARARVRQALTPRWPSNQGAWYHWDDHIYETPDHLIVKKGDSPFTLMGWNEDDSYAHTITFRFIVLPIAVVEHWMRTETTLKRLVDLMTPKRWKAPDNG